MSKPHFHIMSASDCVGNSAKQISTAMNLLGNQEGEYTILVAERHYSFDKRSKIFISGVGKGYVDAMPAVCKYTHDTGNGYKSRGEILVIHNQIVFRDGEIVDPGNGIGVDQKRRWWVMK